MANAVLMIKVVTDLHNGAGQGLSHVDRPIIRERKTGFPYVQAETLKGNFRAEFRLRGIAGDAKLKVLCGDDSGASEHRGFLEFTDAMLLALPVRSLKNGFAWVTTPLILARLQRFCELIGAQWSAAADGALREDVQPGTLLTTETAQAALTLGDKVYLEEFALSVRTAASVGALANVLARALWPADSWWARQFERSFVILHADDFGHFVRHATEVKANIRITQEGENAGTTESGSLRYTEYLPQESLLAALVEAEGVPAQLAMHLENELPLTALRRLVETPDLFQLGADETKGKGLVQFVLIGS